jgi:hypothetical protein
VLHFPGPDKTKEFEEALQRKMAARNFNFCGVWFPGRQSFFKTEFNGKVDFNSATFNDEASFFEAVFRGRTEFKGTKFKSAADFWTVHFHGEADFFGAEFHGEARFSYSTFHRDVFFRDTNFIKKAVFFDATFEGLAVFGGIFNGEADFTLASFNERAVFTEASFKDYLKFWGNSTRQVFGEQSSLRLQDARIEKPEYLFFNTVALRPHWFVDVDARQFNFNNIAWRYTDIHEEIEELKKREVSGPHEKLAIACQRLAANAKENHRHDEVSLFRYLAMDVRRRKKWGGFTPWKLEWWYWAASGYGRRPLQALIVLLGIWLLFASLYICVGFARPSPGRSDEGNLAATRPDETGAPLKPSRSLLYSLGVMTLQKPDPPPVTTMAQSLVMMETILGPLQAALFVLAVRRRFAADLSEE